jgi:hypothetical protein
MKQEVIGVGNFYPVSDCTESSCIQPYKNFFLHKMIQEQVEAMKRGIHLILYDSYSYNKNYTMYIEDYAAVRT